MSDELTPPDVMAVESGPVTPLFQNIGAPVIPDPAPEPKPKKSDQPEPIVLGGFGMTQDSIDKTFGRDDTKEIHKQLSARLAEAAKPKPTKEFERLKDTGVFVYGADTGDCVGC